MSTPEENIKTILADWLDALRRHDFATVERRMDPQVFWQGVREDFICENRDEATEMLREQQREEHGVEALELIATEEKVVLGVRSTQLQEIGGVPLGRQIFQVFTLRHHDGRIVWVDEYRRRGAGGRWSRVSGRLAIGAAGAESPWVTPPPHSSLSSVKMMLLFYLRTSRLWAPSPSGTRKRKAGRSDSIRSKGRGRGTSLAPPTAGSSRALHRER